jgi:hypothetical protein
LIVGAESVSEADEVPEGDPHEFFGEFFEFPPSKFEILKLSDDAGSEQGFRIGSSVSITSTSTSSPEFVSDPFVSDEFEAHPDDPQPESSFRVGDEGAGA